MNNRHGFTLMELMAVTAVIGVLLALSASAWKSSFDAARDAACRNNLRQMISGAFIVAAGRDGEWMDSYERDMATGRTRTWEWSLWELGANFHVQQCPSFRGPAMWESDKFTGYNYNSSYVGGRLLRRAGTLLPGSLPSARTAEILRPHECAIFGDGEYESGANKFMRSPFPGRLDPDASLALAGTQGFRHRGRANVAFADGHVASLSNRYVATAAPGAPARGCGFLSPDNRLYDLE